MGIGLLVQYAGAWQAFGILLCVAIYAIVLIRATTKAEGSPR